MGQRVRLKRFIDLLIIMAVFPFLILPLIIITILIKLTSKGSVIYMSDRVGFKNKIFRMAKFRTMLVDSPQVATHLLKDSKSFLTPIGNLLRKTSLDELPQLYNVLRGEMSLVGPRPALFNQDDLVELRTSQSIHYLKPGVTGWAQVNGRDELSIPHKVELDAYYAKNISFKLDLIIIWMTIIKVLKSDGVSH